MLQHVVLLYGGLHRVADGNGKGDVLGMQQPHQHFGWVLKAVTHCMF